MLKRGFFISLFILSYCVSIGQVIYFDIMKGSDNLGRIRAEKSKNSTGVNYHVKSKAVFRVILEYVRETDMRTYYVGNEFRSSQAKVLMDGKVKEHLETKKVGEKYVCKDALEEESWTSTKPIYFTTTMMYFKEPIGQKYAYAETHQALCPLSKIKEGVYKMVLPGGKVNHYVYKGGKLQEIRVFRSIVDLVFRRAEN